MDLAGQIRNVLVSRGTSLNAVSRRSAELFGRSSRFFVPHNLYSELAKGSRKPTIQEAFALSDITNYRLWDWLTLFGFDLDAVPRLQLLVPRINTVRLDSTVYDEREWIPWFSSRSQSIPLPAVAPLSQLLVRSTPRQIGVLTAPNQHKFYYARIGEGDLHAQSSFAPGAIVRADDRRLAISRAVESERGKTDPFFLVEYDLGWTCSQVTFVPKDRLVLRCTQRTCDERHLRIGREVRILGVVDAVLQPEGRLPRTVVAPPLREKNSTPLLSDRANLREVLRRARVTAGLTFREASSLSRWVANCLSDERHFAAPSTLSDFETLSDLPPQVEKLMTLCVLYSIGFRELLHTGGLLSKEDSRERIPDELMTSHPAPGLTGFRAPQADPSGAADDFLNALLESCEEIPFFLRASLGDIVGIKHLSLSDVFWLGGDTYQKHLPAWPGSAFASVNRRAKRPPRARESRGRPPLYIILKRDGTYVAGRCTANDGILKIHGSSLDPAGEQLLRNGVDAEVVGRVTAIVKRLL